MLHNNADVLGQYNFFLRTKYGMCCVLVDGYEEHSTTDHEHKRRQTGKVSAAILIAENAQVHKDQEALFSNKKNETKYISLLRMHRQDIGHRVEGSRGDADTIIVSSALKFARNGQTVTFVAEATVMQIQSLYPVRLNSLGMVRQSHLWQKTHLC